MIDIVQIILLILLISLFVFIDRDAKKKAEEQRKRTKDILLLAKREVRQANNDNRLARKRARNISIENTKLDAMLSDAEERLSCIEHANETLSVRLEHTLSRLHFLEQETGKRVIDKEQQRFDTVDFDN